MTKTISVAEYISLSEPAITIDVRSPAEFLHGHIPEACSVPLFSDNERAAVGTLYKQVGREEAVRAGLGFVSPKMEEYIELVRHIRTEAGLNKSTPIIVYCARGGMRSQSISMLLRCVGYTVLQLVGGFKAYKQFLCDQVPQYANSVVLLGGKTGSGKTVLLNELAKRGAQVIDLEGIAHHRGSAFGALGLPPQPTQEQFMVLVLSKLVSFDSTKSIWIEHEGSRLGSVHIPPELLTVMEIAPVVYMQVDLAVRKSILRRDYFSFSQDDLYACTMLLEKRLGGAITKQVLAALQAGDRETVLDLLLDHYDRSYEHNVKRNKKNLFIPLSLSGSEPAAWVDQLNSFWSTHAHEVRCHVDAIRTGCAAQRA